MHDDPPVGRQRDGAAVALPWSHYPRPELERRGILRYEYQLRSGFELSAVGAGDGDRERPPRDLDPERTLGGAPIQLFTEDEPCSVERAR